MGDEQGDKEYFVELKDYEAVKDQRDKLTKEMEAMNQSIQQKLNYAMQEATQKQKVQLEAFFQNRIEKIEQEKGRAMTEARSAQMMIQDLQKQLADVAAANDNSAR